MLATGIKDAAARSSAKRDQPRASSDMLTLLPRGTIDYLGSEVNDLGMTPRLFFQLSTAQRAVQRGATQASRSKLTGSQAGVLFLLNRPDGASIGEVARQLEATASSMTELIDRMEAAGLVVRRVDPADGRAQRLTLTAAGQHARQAAIADLGALNKLLTEGFTAEEIAIVSRWLEAVRSRFAKQASAEFKPNTSKSRS